MEEREPLDSWRAGAARIADGLARPQIRVRRTDPALATSSACRHDWLPSPLGATEYCGRCGALRQRPADGLVADVHDAAPAHFAGGVVPTPAVKATVGDAHRGASPEPSVPQRTTRPELVAANIGPAMPRVDPRPRRLMRTVTIGTLVISLGAVIGFVGADAMRDTRGGQGEIPPASLSSELSTGRPSMASAEAPAATLTTPASSEPIPTEETVVAAAGPAVGTPVARLGGRLTSAGMDVELSWEAPLDGRSVSRYDLRTSRDGGAYRKVELARRAARTAALAVAANVDYTVQLRARGPDGTPGEWVTSTVRLERREESGPDVRASKGWKVAEHPEYTGIGARYATAEGAELTLAFDGAGVAIVGPTGPGRGRADVFIDGERAGRFDALGTRFRPVQLLLTVDGLTPGPHILTVRVAGTAGRPMVAVDRFLILAQP